MKKVFLMKPVLKKEGNLKPVRNCNINLQDKRLSLNKSSEEYIEAHSKKVKTHFSTLHFQQSQETLGRCMAEIIDESRKRCNGEQS